MDSLRSTREAGKKGLEWTGRHRLRGTREAGKDPSDSQRGTREVGKNHLDSLGGTREAGQDPSEAGKDQLDSLRGTRRQERTICTAWEVPGRHQGDSSHDCRSNPDFGRAPDFA